MNNLIFPQASRELLYSHDSESPVVKVTAESPSDISFEILTGPGAGMKQTLPTGLFHAYFKSGARIKYVVGFMFSLDKTNVVLISKLRPSRQKGLFNGVGGHVNPGEEPQAAMEREFAEEAGYLADTWMKFHILQTKTAEVTFFWAIGSKRAMDQVRTMTDEPIRIMKVFHVLNPEVDVPIVKNLTWLIPMALDSSHVCSNSQAV